MEIHEILGGKVQLYRRDRSRFWWRSSSVGGKQRRASTKEDSLAHAKEIAEDWYLGLRGKDRDGLLTSEKTFRQAADQFMLCASPGVRARRTGRRLVPTTA
jgi:hypothetical protein